MDHEQLERCMADPTSQFKTPLDVVHDATLDIDDKRRILESWKKDAELLTTAQEENMGGGERPQLQDVHLALQELERLGATH